jgi:hypothetical protein
MGHALEMRPGARFVLTKTDQNSDGMLHGVAAGRLPDFELGWHELTPTGWRSV